MIYLFVVVVIVLITILFKQYNQIEELKKSLDKNKTINKNNFYQNSSNTTGSIAHQWRQPLMELSSLFIDLESQIDTNIQITNKDLSKVIDKSNNILKYMSKTIDDFNNFLNSKRDYEVKNISEIIDMSLDIVENTLKDNDIELIVHKYDDIKVNVVENEYIQVLINIISNAKDILIERGINNPQITITIDKVLVDTDEIPNQAIVYISDNAGGIDLDNIDDIFKPYFSKRNFINSTGMGLFMSKVIIENHFGGKLQAHNNNNGAVFTISLPFFSKN